MKTRDVFISYSQEDKPTADAICARLESTSVRCWIAPRDIQAGRSFAGEITRGIQASKIMVLVFSGHSNQSEQVLREVQLAVDSHLHILQFRIEDVPPSDDLKYFLGTPHWLDALTRPLDRHLDHLSTAVQALLDVTGQMPVSSASANQPTLQPVRAAGRPKPVRRVHPAISIGIVAAAVISGGGIWFFIHRPAQEELAVAQPTSPAPAPQLLASPSPTTTPQLSPTATPLASATATAKNNSESDIREARRYIDRSREHWRKKDYDSALADLDRALELDPTNSNGYAIRGSLRSAKHDTEGALADWNKALELNPKNAAALDSLGRFKLENGESEAAIIYLDRALQSDPRRISALNNRAEAKLSQGDLNGALADLDRALELEPRNVSALERRGVGRMVAGQWEGAASDLRTRCTTEPATQDFSRLALWIAASHLPDIGGAQRELAEYAATRRPPDWPDWNGQIADFLLDKISVTKFLDRKGAFLRNDTKKLSQALMFAGMKSLCEGQRDSAIGYFEDCVRQKQTKSVDFHLAQAELKLLRK